MSTEYSVVNMFGIEFYTLEELENFLAPYHYDVDDLSDDWKSDKLTCYCLKPGNGTNWVVGFNMALGETFDPYREKWAQTFPNCNLVPSGMSRVLSI